MPQEDRIRSDGSSTTPADEEFHRFNRAYRALVAGDPTLWETMHHEDELEAQDQKWRRDHARVMAERGTSSHKGALEVWAPIDLLDAVHGTKTRPQADLFTRDDGQCIFYRGQFNGLHGTDTVGKSFVALFCAVDELNAGRHIIWLDFEDPDETNVVGRLQDLGVHDELIVQNFHYFNPQSAPTDADIDQLCRYARQWYKACVCARFAGRGI
jgi:hypothetical protein